jgi:N6-L-threonylcarbamoyladenine synthase
MKILAIETSCDETAIALIKFQKSRFRILSNIVSSQVKIHAKWGGIVPNLAKREHQRNILPVFKKALVRAGLLTSKTNSKKLNLHSKIQNLKKILKREPELLTKTVHFLRKYEKPKINAIAVTVGPGLEPALWVGVNFARALSYFWGLPIIPVNHIEGHIFANFIDKEFRVQNKNIFPLICLSVAGGHTQLILMKDYGKYASRDILPPVEYKLLGETRDDTAGECFDKVARMLKLGYPGGPIISKLAENGNPNAFNFPRPMIYAKNYDLSFSGLKTAILYFLKKNSSKFIKKNKKDICASFQQAAIDVLIHKTIKAAQEFRAKTVLLSGGVAANYELRHQLKEMVKIKTPNTQFSMPNIQFCTDNAAMIGATAYFHRKTSKKRNWQKIAADANIKI